MLLTDEPTGALIRIPTYHVFAMNTAHHDERSLAVHLPGDVSKVEVGGEELSTSPHSRP
jgi:alpha-L-arabinofuranosidase